MRALYVILYLIFFAFACYWFNGLKTRCCTSTNSIGDKTELNEVENKLKNTSEQYSNTTKGETSDKKDNLKNKYNIFNGKVRTLELLNIPLMKTNKENRKQVNTLNIKTFCLQGNEI